MAGVDPGWSGYLEAGTGMADALRLASQRGAYILSDIATYEVLRHDLSLIIMREGGDDLFAQLCAAKDDEGNQFTDVPDNLETARYDPTDPHRHAHSDADLVPHRHAHIAEHGRRLDGCRHRQAQQPGAEARQRERQAGGGDIATDPLTCSTPTSGGRCRSLTRLDVVVVPST